VTLYSTLVNLARIIGPVIAGALIAAVGLAVLAAAFMPSLRFSGPALVFVGVCSINFSSLGNSTLQLESSPQMRGRAMSFWSVAFLGSTTIGGPIVGWFAEVAGVRWGLALGGIAALIAAALGTVTLRYVGTGKIDPDGNGKKSF
jgi:MFS family permease